ncbi:MAG: AAA family ATPase [Pseudomonadota bacterium]
MRRVMIIGQPGSGKSTLARAVAEIAHLPVIHVDHIHWKAGWVERSRGEKTKLCLEAHARPQWVFEGGHSVTWSDRLARADTLIWIDLPVSLRLWRIGKRTLRWYGRNRPDLPAGCPEQVDVEFFRYIWRTRDTGRASCAKLFAAARADHAAHHLRSPRQVAGYLSALRRAASGGNLGISHR